MIERTWFATGKQKLICDLCCFPVGVLMVLFRNNAIYAIAIFLIFAVFLVEKKEKIRALLVGVILLALGALAKEGIIDAIGTEIRAPKAEMYSVIMQSFARVGARHGDVLDMDVYRTISRYVPEDCWKNYTPHISDPVKGRVAQVYAETWEPNLGKVILDWIGVGLKYPNEYIDSFLQMTAGYWFLDDVKWAEPFEVGVEYKNGSLTTRNSAFSELVPNGKIEMDSIVFLLFLICSSRLCIVGYWYWPSWEVYI